jgi:hypothetical protein
LLERFERHFQAAPLIRLDPVVADYLDVKLAHGWPTALFTGSEFRWRRTRVHNVSAMKPQAPSAPTKTNEKPDMKSGLPGAPEEQRRDLRAAMKKHEETLRRLAQ